MTDSNIKKPAAVAQRWWRGLALPDQNPRLSPGRRRAALATLRRATSLLQVLHEPEALRLILHLQEVGVNHPQRVATLAGVLASVREDHKTPVARALGRKSLDDEMATLSEARFRRLLQVDDDQLLDAMRRVVALAKQKVDVRDLSYSILFWGDAVKRRWIFRYYGVDQAIQTASSRLSSGPRAHRLTQEVN